MGFWTGDYYSEAEHARWKEREEIVQRRERAEREAELRLEAVKIVADVATTGTTAYMLCRQADEVLEWLMKEPQA